jgi:serine/threonine protein kinase
MRFVGKMKKKDVTQCVPASDALAQSSLPSFASAELLEPGTIWNGRFRIESTLGTGATSTVYRATHLQVGLVVALKIMHDSAAMTKSIHRFMKEARLISALSHPTLSGSTHLVSVITLCRSWPWSL